METNERYYARRAVEELRAAARAVTPEAQARRRALAEIFQLKCQAERQMAAGAGEMSRLGAEVSAGVSLSGA